VDESAAAAGPDLDVQTSSIDGVEVLTVRGALDLLTAPTLAEAIDAALGEAAGAVVVDLSKLEFLASAGMTVLLEGHAAACDVEKGFAVVADGPGTSRPMRMMGVDQVVAVHPTLEAALGDLRATGRSAPDG
jgi:anti-sigma B factor antagonist